MTPSDFERLIRLYGDGLYRFVARMAGAARAEDLTQEVFMKALTATRVPERAAEKSWLFTIANNLCIDALRGAQYDRERATRWAARSPSNDATPEDAAADAEDRDRVTKAVQRLSPPQRRVLLLKVEGGFTFEEISRMLDEPRDTVAGRMYAAIDALRDLLTREEV